MFTEHRLVADDKANREFKFCPRDPTWQALCHYYSAVLREGVKCGFTNFDYRSAITKIAAGTVMAEPGGGGPFPYPSSWNDLQYLETLAPSALFALLTVAIDEGELSRPKASPHALSMGNFKAQMNMPPGPNLTVAEVTSRQDGNPFFILDDGCLMSGLASCERLDPGSLSGTEVTLRMVRLELPTNRDSLMSFFTDKKNEDVFVKLWVRWLRDSVIKRGVRDVVCAGVQVPWREIFAVKFPACIKTPEQAFVILNALLRGLWPKDIGQSFLDHLHSQFENDIPKMVTQLPEALLSKAQGPLRELTSYRW